MRKLCILLKVRYRITELALYRDKVPVVPVFCGTVSHMSGRMVIMHDFFTVLTNSAWKGCL